ncbi:MAG: HD domain-containing phosphohydrolase [Mobilitalea sp.]
MKHILVTNHDAELLVSVVSALQDEYQISIFQKEELQDYVQEEQPDLILVTIPIDACESMNTLDEIGKRPEFAGTPVVFFAGHENAWLEQQAIEKGVQDYLFSSMSKELLLHRISTCLELYELRRQKPYMDKYQDAISYSFAELVDFRDETTGGHLKNTQRYFYILWQEAMKSDRYKGVILSEDTRDILRSVMLHDIGKIGINDEVLRKSSSLDRKEFEYMKTHTILGKQAFDRIIKETGGTRWLYLARDMAYSHHERWDGTGYPEGISGTDIPLYARMLAIADVYDALTSDRSYKEAFSHQKATDIILEEKGRIFDPDMVELFMSVNGQFEDALNKKQEKE